MSVTFLSCGVIKYVINNNLTPKSFIGICIVIWHLPHDASMPYDIGRRCSSVLNVYVGPVQLLRQMTDDIVRSRAVCEWALV